MCVWRAAGAGLIAAGVVSTVAASLNPPCVTHLECDEFVIKSVDGTLILHAVMHCGHVAVSFRLSRRCIVDV